MVNKNNKKDKTANLETPKYKKALFRIDEAEKNSVIVNVSGWRMRIEATIDKNTNIEDIVGKTIEVEYLGDINNPTKDTPKFKAVKI